MNETEINEEAYREFRRWVERTKGDTYHEKLIDIKDNPDEISDAFSGELAFTSSGIRGLIGPGTCRINKFVIRRTSQGISDYLKREHKPVSVVIGYDSRRGSRYFAYEAAAVFRGNLIKPFLFEQLVPVSVLSYAVKALGCDIGIMITAEQEHKIYNGYKVYDSDGHQISQEIAAGIQEEIRKNDYFAPDIFMDNKSGIYKVESRIQREFADKVAELSTIDDKSVFDDFKVIYTPLNGSGKSCFTEVMNKVGIHYELVKDQAEPDKEFPTCPVPNPEKIMAYNESFKWLDEHGGDIIIAHDADSGKVGCAIEHDGMRTVLTGNQTGLLLLDYLCHIKPPKAGQIMLRSVCSSPLAVKIAENFGLEVKTVVNGFSQIGAVLCDLSSRGLEDTFYYAIDESDEYLIDPFVHEKDGISTALCIAEMAAFHKKRGKNLIERLYELYNENGICVDKTRNYFFTGKTGEETIEKLMDFFRNGLANTIGGRDIVTKTDYMTKEEPDRANIVELDLNDGSKLIIRPLVNEPIIKIYSFETCDFSEVEKEISDIVDKYKTIANE